MYDEGEKSYEPMAIGGPLDARCDTAAGMLGAARATNECCAPESMRSRAMRKAQTSAADAARHERLAQKLTPEIEQILWCWQEAIALGLIDVPKSPERRDRY